MADGTYKKITNVSPGEMVVSYNEKKQVFENKEVTAFYNQGAKEVIELCLSNGEKITCTEDHPFLTKNRGWVCANDLTEEDDIAELSKTTN
jgi:intein/homing endonuclease